MPNLNTSDLVSDTSKVRGAFGGGGGDSHLKDDLGGDFHFKVDADEVGIMSKCFIMTHNYFHFYSFSQQFGCYN